LSKLVSFEMLKLVSGILLSSRFVPLLFMGEEYGEEQPFQYFVDHGDPELVKAVREGRKNEFKSFQWEGDVPDPQSRQTFFNSRLLWNFQANIQKSHIFSYYKALIKARKEGIFASLREKDIEVNFTEEEKFLSVLSGEGKNPV